MNETSKKERLSALLFVCFLGSFGGHRFYVGKVGTGILWLCTFGCLGVGTLVDFCRIVAGSFKDKQGKPLKNWIYREVKNE